MSNTKATGIRICSTSLLFFIIYEENSLSFLTLYIIKGIVSCDQIRRNNFDNRMVSFHILTRGWTIEISFVNNILPGPGVSNTKATGIRICSTSLLNFIIYEENSFSFLTVYIIKGLVSRDQIRRNNFKLILFLLTFAFGAGDHNNTNNNLFSKFATSRILIFLHANR